MNRHWTEDDFIARIYGIGRPDAHLEGGKPSRTIWFASMTQMKVLICSYWPMAWGAMARVSWLRRALFTWPVAYGSNAFGKNSPAHCF